MMSYGDNRERRTIALAGLTAVAVVVGHNASLELVFLDIEMILYRC